MFDTHAHYNDGRFDGDREELLSDLKNKGVSLVLNCGADLKSSIASIELAKKYDFIYASVGVHPHDVKDLKDGDIEKLRVMAKESKVVAIGEIGLDYHYDYSPRDLQKLWFERQMVLADELKLPIIIHSREACMDTLNIVKKHYNTNMRGIIHAFSESLDIAKEYVNMGFYLGIGGVITFKNAKKLVEVVENIDIEHLVIETDAPYLSPEPNRGKRNDSTNLNYVVKKIAKIKGMGEDEVVKVTTKNGMRVFGIG